MFLLKRKISRSSISMLFYQIVLIEIFLGGSGQIFKVYGGLSLRMLLFGCMPFVYIITNKSSFNRKILFICFVFTLLLISGITISYINSNDLFLFEDIKPLLYFYTLIYFYKTVSTKKYVDVFVNLLIKCSVFISVLYLIYLSIVKADIIPFLIVYEFFSSQTDIIFRGTGGEFYFKGFIFLPVAFSFMIFRKGLFNLPTLLVLLAIFYSQTRALYLITFIALLIYIIYYKKFRLLMLAGFVVFIFILSLDFSSFDNREDGDLIRITTMEQVVERVNPFSIIFGHGLGFGVPAKPLHMEMAYLEIFHKQGVLGLLFWIMYLLYLTFLYYDSSRERKIYLLPFLSSIFMVYIQSLFNPYIINSMGMCMLFMSLTVLLRFNKIS